MSHNLAPSWGHKLDRKTHLLRFFLVPLSVCFWGHAKFNCGWLVGGVAAYNYKYNYEYWTTYFEEHKERLFMHMNQGTMVVSESMSV